MGTSLMGSPHHPHRHRFESTAIAYPESTVVAALRPVAGYRVGLAVTALAAAATVALVVVIALGRRAMRRIHAFVDRRYHPRIHDVQFKSIDIVRGEQVWRAVERAIG